MNHLFALPRKKLAVLAGAGAGLTFLFTGHAQVVTLVDGNSVAQIDVNSQAGMFAWQVQTQASPVSYVNNLNQQWFWCRIGASGGEHSIDTLGPAVVSTPNARTLYATYANPALSVEIDYSLKGGSPPPASFNTFGAVSDISEIITLSNKTSAALDLHFFQYSDFDLLGTPEDDMVALSRNSLPAVSTRWIRQ